MPGRANVRAVPAGPGGWRPSEPWTFAIARAPRTASRPTMARLGMGGQARRAPQPQDEGTLSRRSGSFPGEGSQGGTLQVRTARGRKRKSSRPRRPFDRLRVTSSEVEGRPAAPPTRQGSRPRVQGSGRRASLTPSARQEATIRDRGWQAGPCRTSRFGAARHAGSETDERVGRFPPPPRGRSSQGFRARRVPRSGNRPRARTVSRAAEAAREARGRLPAATQNRGLLFSSRRRTRPRLCWARWR
jgi:hypothetical protein